MKKKIIYTLLMFLLLFGGIYTFGLYPAAQVNGEVIWQRTLADRVFAAQSFEEKRRQAAGEKMLS